jgi:hypothetical protein
MIKSIYLSLSLTAFVHTFTLGQNSTVTEDTSKQYRIDSSRYLVGNKPTIQVGDNINILGKMLNQQFGNIVTGQSTSTIGNFASISPTQGKIDFAGSILLKKAGIVSIKASGKATDGILSIFENSRLNTQVGLEVKWHILNMHRYELSFDRDSGLVHDEKVRGIINEYKKAKIHAVYRRDSMELEVKCKRVETELDSLKKRRSIDMDTKARFDLEYAIANRENILDSITDAVSHLRSKNNLLRSLKNKTINELDKMTLVGANEGFSISWFSIGYKVNHNKFSYFNSKAVFENQVNDTNFVSHEVTAQYTWYTWNSQGFKTYYISVGGGLSVSDNFSKLDKREISETVNYGATPGARSVTKKFDAYEGLYERDLTNGKIFFDGYWFLFSKNIAALHLNPEWTMKNQEKPLGNVLAGLMLSIPKKDESSTILNAELYYQFLDVFKSTETDYKLFERNSIGLRFTFPIQFKYK